MTVYASASRRSIDELQNFLDLHAISSADGRCVRCKVEGPCEARAGALRELGARHQLPRRRAGATRPELIGARKVVVSNRPM
jgi:hypothetical protein